MIAIVWCQFIPTSEAHCGIGNMSTTAKKTENVICPTSDSFCLIASHTLNNCSSVLNIRINQILHTTKQIIEENNFFSRPHETPPWVLLLTCQLL